MSQIRLMRLISLVVEEARKKVKEFRSFIVSQFADPSGRAVVEAKAPFKCVNTFSPRLV